MKILITGALGHIGSYVITDLIKLSAESASKFRGVELRQQLKRSQNITIFELQRE